MHRQDPFDAAVLADLLGDASEEQHALLEADVPRWRLTLIELATSANLAIGRLKARLARVNTAENEAARLAAHERRKVEGRYARHLKPSVVEVVHVRRRVDEP